MEQQHEFKLSMNTARKIINGIFDIPENELALIADGTYIYIEQPKDYKTQKLLLSGQKKGNLAKVIMLVLPSGRIVEAAGAFGFQWYE